MMRDSTTYGAQLQELLKLNLPPVGIAFRPTPPSQVRRIETPSPAGCVYWRLAAEGKVFYTEASDHYSCPIGAHTHGVDLPPAVAHELNGLVQKMGGMQYITMQEVQALPRGQGAFGVAVYAPLDDLPCEADVVLVRGSTKQMMLLAEASQSAGIASSGATMGRPTCAVLPQTMQSGQTAASLGCIGNRVYTGLGEGEGYYAIPGRQVSEVVSRLVTMIQANQQLEIFHRSRVSSVAEP
ncbi:MAG: DUF169 domain-containing protein [Nitrospiraceae bacterium]